MILTLAAGDVEKVAHIAGKPQFFPITEVEMPLEAVAAQRIAFGQRLHARVSLNVAVRTDHDGVELRSDQLGGFHVEQFEQHARLELAQLSEMVLDGAHG